MRSCRPVGRRLCALVLVSVVTGVAGLLILPAVAGAPSDRDCTCQVLLSDYDEIAPNTNLYLFRAGTNSGECLDVNGLELTIVSPPSAEVIGCSIAPALGYANGPGDHAWWVVGYTGPWQLMPLMGVVITNAPGPMVLEANLTRDGELICSTEVTWPGTLTAVEEPDPISWGFLKSLYGE